MRGIMGSYPLKKPLPRPPSRRLHVLRWRWPTCFPTTQATHLAMHQPQVYIFTFLQSGPAFLESGPAFLESESPQHAVTHGAAWSLLGLQSGQPINVVVRVFIFLFILKKEIFVLVKRSNFTFSLYKPGFLLYLSPRFSWCYWRLRRCCRLARALAVGLRVDPGAAGQQPPRGRFERPFPPSQRSLGWR
jgi:hypothetical protein